ncbi:hypothetical protein [Yoonia sp. BS5-3]|uniref:Lipoprotein n=1 Tax=Yoonia phaeophyticola TaxID=3137369 RepID=A0ABZ2V8C5_9RHOB
MPSILRKAVGLLCIIPTVAAAQSSAALRACHGVDFDPSDDAPFIIFSAHSYPAVAEKMDRDFDTEDLPDLLALGKFSSFAIHDAFVPLLMVPCSYEAYDATGCRTNFLFGASQKVEDVTRTGERLSFTLIDEEDGVVNTIVVGNRSYDDMTLTSTKGGTVTTSSWSRAGDGTETYEGNGGDGNVIRYTERSDCSGEGYIAEAENGVVRRTFDASWTSTKEATFTLTYEMCNFVDGTDCVSGSF